MERENFEKMKNVLYELTTKNEMLNKNNNDLNVKLLSLTRLIKIKETQIKIINNLLIKKALKNLLLQKYIKENKALLNAFTNLKYYKKRKYLQPKLYYDHDIYFYILKTNKTNLLEKGVGNYNINLKLYIRRQTCLTLLRKRKYINHNQTDISYLDKSSINYNNYSLIDNKKKCFENITIDKNENRFLIKSRNNKNKNNKQLNLNYNLKINNYISYNIINNICKEKKYDFSVSHFKIICNKRKKYFDDKKLINNNSIKFSILFDNTIKNYKNEIEKYMEKEKYYKNIENEFNCLKNDLTSKNKNIEELKNVCRSNELQIDKLNKNLLQLEEELIKTKTENNNYKENENKINKKSIKNKILYEYTKINFNIISNNKTLKNKNEKKNKNNILLYSLSKSYFNIISNNIKKENNKLFNVLSKSNIINYNIFPNTNNNNNKHKDNLIIKNIQNLYFPGDISSKKEILYSFEQALKDIENKNNLFKLLIFETKLNNYSLYHKYFFYIKFLHYIYKQKIQFTFDSLRNILITLKLKQIIKNIPSYKLHYFFYKYYTKTVSFSFNENKITLSKYIYNNEELEKKLNLFTDTFKQYEQTHTNEDEKKNNELTKYKNTINDLNIELEKVKNSARESTEELINSNNECINQKKIINGLNDEINELKKNKNILENKIISQQDLIKNINSKMQQCQEENEQNEQNYTSQMEQVQSRFEEYKNNITELNKEKQLLIKDNDKLKTTIENLNNSNEKMFEIVKNSKNYEIENESLLKENKQLKSDNEIINNRYKGLKEDFDNLKILSEESKNELTKAMHEMELYSELLQTLENKINIAENDKKNALNERDKAINDVKALRQRYINIMGDGFI